MKKNNIELKTKVTTFFTLTPSKVIHVGVNNNDKQTFAYNRSVESKISRVL